MVPMKGGQVVPWNLLSSHSGGAPLFGGVYQMAAHIPSKSLSLELSHGAV